MIEWINETGKYMAAASPLLLLLTALLPSSWLDRQPQKAARLGSLLALGSLAASLLAILPMVLGGPIIATFLEVGPFRLGIYYDVLSAILLLLVSLLAAVILRYSENYLAGDPKQGLLTRWLCLTSGSVLVLAISGNLLLFAAAWIAVSLCLHRLLVFYPDRPGALLAARKKFIFSRMGDICLLAAILLIYQKFQTLDFQELFQKASLATDESAGVFTLIGLLLVACAILKSAQFPFHSWLPDTMETPTPVSALMHAGIINAGGFLIVRLSPVVVLSPEAMMVLALVGGFTALFASLTMLTHASIKRALAFSTVAQMGFMMLECGLGAFSLAVLHLTAHSLYKAHAFLSSGSILQLSRSAWVPDSLPRAHPLALAGTLTATALLTFGSAWIMGLDLWKNPGAFFLGLVFWFSQAYMLWNLWSHSRGVIIVAAGLVLASLVSFAGFGLHFLFESLLAPVLPIQKVGWDWMAGALAAFPFLLFLAVLVFQTQLPVWYKHPLCQAFYVHARNGFYFTTLANRMVAVFWPLHPTSLPTISRKENP